MEKRVAHGDCQPDDSCETHSLEKRFSMVRGDEIMEEVLAAVREYLQEKDTSDG
ncbi:MAG: hypothetical protein JRJ85_11050 [Deltaproteobacteria bacterium]|nr:hypothetical protein [Deltaproteobacteria bacterium]